MTTLQSFPQLEKINSIFILKLNLQISKFLNGEIESPKWLQFRHIENNFLIFKSSQNSTIGFSIDLTNLLSNEEIDELQFAPYNELYSYFKELKYEKLKEYNIERVNYTGFTK